MMQKITMTNQSIRVLLPSFAEKCALLGDKLLFPKCHGQQRRKQ
jgi:hypothetical protein